MSRFPLAARWLAGALGAAALAANTVILLSDRAPGLFRRLSDRLDVGTVRTAAAQVTPGGDVPRSDFILHVTLWAVATALIGLATRSTRSRVMAASTVLAYSVALEIGQGVFTQSRSPQAADIVANAIGVAAGLALAVAVGLVLWYRPARAG